MDLARLGVNIDHFATLRQLRGTAYPDLLEVVRVAESAGADQITAHLREDRRHIQDDDVKILRKHLKVAFNLEMAGTDAMVRIACRTRPEWACLVPEKRQELTTEGGLDLSRSPAKWAKIVTQLHRAKIKVSFFIEPSITAVRAAAECGADAVELHTGRFCHLHLGQPGGKRSASLKKAQTELTRLEQAAREARRLGLGAHAGHGLDVTRTRILAALSVTQTGTQESPGRSLFEEYNIGHWIVCRAAVIGLAPAIREMISAIRAP